MAMVMLNFYVACGLAVNRVLLRYYLLHALRIAEFL